jgi:hypothetical protein
LSIPRLVASLQSEPSVSESVAKNAEDAIAAVGPSIVKIRHLRDKVFGHRDRSYTYERAFDDANLSGDEVKDLIDKTLQIINGLMKARNQGTYDFEHYTERDLLKLLDDIHSARSHVA